MKKSFKLIFAAFVSLFCASAAFAWSFDTDSIMGGVDGAIDYDEWSEAVTDKDLCLEIFASSFEGEDVTISVFAQKTDSNSSSNDYEVIDYIESAIPAQFGAKKGTAYSFIVPWNMTDYEFEGWMVFTYCTGKNKFVHAMYYFYIEY